MKKLLALVLALVMVLGLATVSTNAALSDFSDAKDVSMKEAMSVMNLVGVFMGSDGKIDPKGNLTREQACKLIAYLDLGEKTAEALPAIQVFSDVAATRWSAKYVAYCADAGYVGGVGDNKFDPAGSLTGYAFGKMLLCVLGYDANVEGFGGANWTIAVAKKMQANDIAEGVDTPASAALTREQGAQYCLNALKATMVEYDNKGTTISINGATIATGASAAKQIANKKANDYRKNPADADELLQLAEKLYPKLSYAAASDSFGREGMRWTLSDNKTDIFGAAAAYTFTAKSAIAAADDNYATLLSGVNKALGFTKNADKLKKADDFAVNVNGYDADSDEVAVNIGDDVEVFADDGKISNIVVKSYEFGTIDKVDKEVTEADADDGVGAYITIEGTVYNDKDITGFDAATYTKGAKVLFIAKGDSIIDSYPATVVEEVSFSSRASNGQTAVAGGKTYTAYNKTDLFKAAKIGSDKYDLYLDANGYARGFDTVAAAAATLDDVYYVTASYKKAAGTDEYGQPLDEFGYVQAVALDGTITSFTVENNAEAIKLVGKLVTFSKVSKKDYMAGKEYKTNDDYTVMGISNVKLETSTKRLSGQYLTKSTEYVIITTGAKLQDTKATVKVGGVAYSGVDGFVISHKSGTAYTADYVVMTDGTAATETHDDKLYVNDLAYTIQAGDDGNYNEFTVYDATTGKTKDINAGSATTLALGFNTYETDDDGVYTLTPVAPKALTADTTWTKDFTGVLDGAAFKSYYGGLLDVTKSGKVLSEIAAGSTIVVDLHDTGAAGQYGKSVTNLETLDTLMNGSNPKVDSARMTLDIDKDGAVIIFITSIVAA